MPTPDPDFARMGRVHRVGVLALCLGAGSALGFLGTLGHQSLQPWGVGIALLTVALFVSGLRLWSGGRAPVLAGAVGLGVMITSLATVTDGSVLVPANAAGYAWLVGFALIAAVVIGWPNVQRRRPASAATMDSTGASAPETERFTEQKDPSLP